MEYKTTYIETVHSCNRLFNEKTLHPLVSVIDLANAHERERLRLDCYSVMLCEQTSGDLASSRMECDFADGTMLFRAPDKMVPIETSTHSNLSGRLLVFHPDLFCGTKLGKKIHEYTFFKYKLTEALHLSQPERVRILAIFDGIKAELEWGVDCFSQSIICNKLELLLTYCSRYYIRQMVLRRDSIDKTVEKVTENIDAYIMQGRLATDGKPCTCKFAAPLGLSSAYLNDVLQHETGLPFEALVESRRLRMARQQLTSGVKTDADIAAWLGYANTALMYSLTSFNESTRRFSYK
uniref:AraC family transcriptional regulator n=1 Tax=Prevotella sp. GTC17259 TaxID=3236795 RepID=A0AB33JAU2_9BACT